MLLPKVEAMIAQVFQEKTAQPWGSVQPGQVAKDGKYWLQQLMKPNSNARWEYFVDDRVDGKKDGWYPYEPSATEEVEALYAQHVADNCGKRTATRILQSGEYSYKVDLTKMSQENTRTRKVRQIRRVFGKRPPVATLPAKTGSRQTARKRKTATRRAAGKKRAAPKTKAAAKKRGTSKRSVSLRKVAKAVKARTRKVTKVTKAMKSAKDSTMPKALTAMKARKINPRKVKVARGRYRRSMVFQGKRERTGGGMKKEDFYVNKKGRVVSKKRSAVASKMLWPRAVRQARTELGFAGFFPLGGKSVEGRAFLEKAKSVHAQFKRERHDTKREQSNDKEAVVQDKAKAVSAPYKAEESNDKAEQSCAKVEQ